MRNAGEISKGFQHIESSELLDSVKDLRERGYRFAQACADNTEDGVELIYTFSAREKMTGLRVNLGEDEEIPSITFVYWTAFASELDIARDFGVSFRHIASDRMDEFCSAERLSMTEENIRREAEFLMEGQGIADMADVAERMPGMSSFANSLGYCMAVEAATGTGIPERAVYLRVILLEITRIESHIFWLASLAEHIGFESLAALCWNVRERILDLLEKISGSRIMLSICCVGGLRHDVSQELLDEVTREMKALRGGMKTLEEIFMEDGSVQARLRGIGVLDGKPAEGFCVGPVAKASGIGVDARDDESFSLYRELGFTPVIEDEGDCAARCRIRIREISQSADLIDTAVGRLPDGDFATEAEEAEAGEAAVRIEQPDGQAFYYAKVTADGLIKRFAVRMPTDINMPALVSVMDECDPADLDVLALTMDPCVRDVEW